MTGLQALFVSGRIVDAVLALLLLEALLLLRWRGRASPWPTLAAGTGLLLAWRLHLDASPWTWVAAALSAAGAAHAWELWRLWRTH